MCKETTARPVQQQPDFVWRDVVYNTEVGRVGLSPDDTVLLVVADGTTQQLDQTAALELGEALVRAVNALAPVAQSFDDASARALAHPGLPVSVVDAARNELAAEGVESPSSDRVTVRAYELVFRPEVEEAKLHQLYLHVLATTAPHDG